MSTPAKNATNGPSFADALASQMGNGQKLQGVSFRTFVLSLGSGVALFAIELLIFMFGKDKLPSVYRPRGQSDSELGYLGRIKSIFLVPDKKLIQQCGLDAYFFLRYLVILLKIFIPLAILTLPILLPINIWEGRAVYHPSQSMNVTGLDHLAWENIAPSRTNWYWVHLGLAVITVTYTCVVLFYEHKQYLGLRQEFAYMSSSKTILVTDIPKNLSEEATLLRMYRPFPGGVQNIWLNKNYEELNRMVIERSRISFLLESAETSFIQKLNRSSYSPPSSNLTLSDSTFEDFTTDVCKNLDIRKPSPNTSPKGSVKTISPPAQCKYRQKIRLPKFPWLPAMPLLCEKTDAIRYYQGKLRELNYGIEKQKGSDVFPSINSAFVQFHSQKAADIACYMGNYASKMKAVTAISPNDIIWENLLIGWWSRHVRTVAIFIIICAMAVGWSVPVAFAGLLSQITYLDQKFSFLHWLEKAPSWVSSLIQGILPPLALAALLAVLPAMLRGLLSAQGLHTIPQVEIALQRYFFPFLLIQTFFVVSISSSFSVVFRSISDNVYNIPRILAENLPKASNFFFSYMILQALSVSAGALAQIQQLMIRIFIAPIVDKTATAKINRKKSLTQIQWGTFFPIYTMFATIGLIYSIIAPLILVFSIVTFSLFLIVYRYNLLYVTGHKYDTGGILFPSALNQLFTGLYLMELSLIGLFWLVRDEKDNVACRWQAICMSVVTACTVLYQWVLNRAFSYRLPITVDEVTKCERVTKMSSLQISF